MTDDDKAALKALKTAYEAAVIGDVPDMPLGVLTLLKADGWVIRRKQDDA